MSLVMDFLENALPTAGAVIGGIATAPLEALDAVSGVGGTALNVAGASAGSAAGEWLKNEIQGKPGGTGVLGAAIGGAVGQGVGGLAAKGAEALAPEAATVGSKIATGAVKGAAVGGAASTASSVAQGQPVNPKNLTMDFIQGAAIGGVTGGAVEGVKAGQPLGKAGGGKPFSGLSDDAAAKAAKEQDPEKVQKILAPETGPVVAQDVAPAVATTSQGDPAVVKTIVQNDVVKKVTPAVSDTPEVANPSPAPEPIPAPTPTSNITTPTQVAGQSAEEASLFATEQQQPKDFINAPGEEPAKATSHVSNLAAVQDMHDMMNAGASPTDAVAHYMEKTNSTPQEAQKAVNDLLGQAGGSLNKGMVGADNNPEFANASKMLPDVQAGAKDQAVINPKVIHNELNRNATEAANQGNELNKSDLALMDTAHGKTLEQLLPQAQDKAAFTDAYNALKKSSDVEHAIQSNPDALGMQVPYLQNHMGQMMWDNSDKEIADAQAKRVTMSNEPGWSKARTIQNYQEGMQLGLTPKNYQDGAPGIIYRDLQDNLQQKQSVLGQQALYKGLEQAYPGKVSIGDRTTPEEGVWKQLQVPYGQKLFMPADLANEINARAPAPDSQGGWEKYDKFNGNWKNLKLAGGGFHSLNTMGNFFASQIATGRIFTHPEDSVTMLRSLFDKNFNDGLIKQWNDSGKTVLEDIGGLNAKIHSETPTTPGELPATGTEGDIKAEGRLGNIPALKQMHEAVFGRQIPMMMKLEYHQNIDGLDPSIPEDRAQMVTIAKSINQRYGAQNRDIQGVTAKTAQLGGRGVLAWNWNEGQIKTLVDALSKGGVEGKMARQVVFGKALLFGGLATAGGAAGGEFKNQTPEQVALDILHKTVNPSFKFGSYTVGLPTTQLSLPGKPITEAIGNAASGKSIANPLKDVASARLAAVPSGVEQVMGNRTFSGQPIAGKDFYGRPITPGQTAGAIAGMVAPIPATQGVQTVTGKQNIGASIANVVGLNVRPTNTLEYAPLAGQTYIAQLSKTPGVTQPQIQSDTQFFEALGQATAGKAKNRTIQAAETAIKAGNTDKAQQVIDSYNQKLIQALLPWAQQGGTKYLDNTMMSLLRSAELNTGKVNKQVAYTTKTNPTSIGAPINPLAQQPQLVNQ